MTSTSTEDRARYFMQYGGFEPYEPSAQDEFYYYESLHEHEIYKGMIMNAAESHIDDVAFAFNSPKSGSVSELYLEICDDLDNLSTDTLRILANVMAKKN
jgi:hypothetical protein